MPLKIDGKTAAPEALFSSALDRRTRDLAVGLIRHLLVPFVIADEHDALAGLQGLEPPHLARNAGTFRF